MSLELSARLQKIIFTSPDEKFLVAEFIDVKSAKRFRASGPALTFGKQETQQNYRIFGDWVETPKYGPTFQMVYAEPERPQSVAGLVPFLVNNIKGVGEATAKKLVEEFQIKSVEDLVLVCQSNESQIQKFFKSKKKQADALVKLMTGNEAYRGIMVFLHENNIPARFAERIFQKYGSAAMSLLLENPYRLIWDFRNVGFLKADAVAQKLGVDPRSLFRFEAAFSYALQKAKDDGNCCLARDPLVDIAATVLNHQGGVTFSKEEIVQNLRQVFRNNRETTEKRMLVRQTDEGVFFYLPELFRLENKVANRCHEILARSGLGSSDLERKLEAGELAIEDLAPDVPWDRLSDEQRQAVQLSVGSRLMILTGGPGCGKTFVLKSIYKVQKRLGRVVGLAAPTGLAAKRMTLSIEAQASTLHKLLRIGNSNQNSKTAPSAEMLEDEVGSTFAEDNSLASDSSSEGSLDHFEVVIVDESSMLSLDLMATLLGKLPSHARLILVGDVDQLPSIGAGNCLRDLIASGKIPVARLTKIFRQGHESPIPYAAQEVILGKKPNFALVSRSPQFAEASSLAFVPCSADVFSEHLVAFLKKTVPQLYGLDPKKDCQTLVPMRKSQVGQDAINALLQEELNPIAFVDEEAALHTYRLPNGQVLRTGDKVIQTKNNYEKEVFNGDLGFVSALVKTKDKCEIDVAFVDKTVRFEDEEADDLQLCYAMTIHKSQGSEFPLVIIPMFSAYYSMLDRNLLYTAVTRASRHVIVFGEEWAIKKAVGSTQAVNRSTSLRNLLVSESGSAVFQAI